MDFVGSGKRFKPEELVSAAAALAIDVVTIRSVLEVETAGAGFDGERRIKLLFEPHIFYAQLGPGTKRDEAVKLGLAYPEVGMRPYPPLSKRYDQISKAIDIALGAWWLSPEGTRAVLERMEPHIQGLKATRWLSGLDSNLVSQRPCARVRRHSSGLPLQRKHWCGDGRERLTSVPSIRCARLHSGLVVVQAPDCGARIRRSSDGCCPPSIARAWRQTHEH
jgi:hypothetical protein